MVITFITATCDQPTGLALCERWMAAQVFDRAGLELQWLVVDDGLEPAHVTAGQEYIRRERAPTTSGAASLCLNLLAAAARVRGERILIWEHDDYYAPAHVARMLALLDRPNVQLAGDDQQRYFHVATRRWRIFQNRGAALCQTGLRREARPRLVAAATECLAHDQYGVDALLWQQMPRQHQCLERMGTVVGIKGLPGRRGLGLGHRPEVIKKWTADPTLATLRSWIGPDADVYAPFAAPAGDPTSAPASAEPPPRLVACYFGAGEDWPRLARALAHSAHTHCPSWTREIVAIAPPAQTSARGSEADAANTQKLEHWCHVVDAAPTGTRLLLMDADTIILRPLDPLWTDGFDVAYTVRARTARYPLNAGVIAVRVSDRARGFIRAWRDENAAMLADRVRHDRWRQQYGGINQAALGAVLERGAARGLQLRQLPCAEWNCEDDSWAHFSGATRILHVKSALRLAVFGRGPRPRALAPLVVAWRDVDRAAGESETAPAEAKPSPVEGLAPANPTPPRASATAAASPAPEPSVFGHQGRKRPATMTVTVRVPLTTYDTYCRAAAVSREARGVSGAMRRALVHQARRLAIRNGPR